MNRMIVAVFDSEEQAYEGLTALKTLHDAGDISLFADAVISKSGSDKAEIRQISDKGPLATAVGAVSGAFIGILGGPAGMVVGASAGMLGGMFFDLNEAGIDSGFVDEVSKALDEGKVAVIAEIDEGWTTPVDKRMDELGAMVFRRNKAEVADEQLDREIEATNQVLDELDDELQEASDEAAQSIKEQISKSKDKLRALKDYGSKKLEHMQEELDAKSDELNKQIQDSDAKKIDKLNKRAEKIKADFEAKKEKIRTSLSKISID